MKSIFRRFTSLLLTALMVIALLPQVALPAFAATDGTLSLSDPDIGLSYSGSADNAWSASGNQVTGSAISQSNSCGGGRNDSNSKLTITNKKTTSATLKFDYTIASSDGQIKVDGKIVRSNGSFSKELSAGSKVEIYILSGSTTAATTIVLNNIQLIVDSSVTVTFKAPDNGSYTVDGVKIENDTEKTQSSLTAYKVVATPNAGYKFLGWYNETTQKYISTSETASLNIASNGIITAKFVPAADAIFETGGTLFADLNDAIAYAQSNRQAKITLEESGSVVGKYTIPSGVTLLIPFDDAETLYTTTPKALDSGVASTKKNEFKRLTLAGGASITVQGAISVGGQYASAAGSKPGKMTGNYGQIQIESGSSITVANGGNLYAWGFVSGAGTVTVKSGGTVYEWFQICDFRGGSATIKMGNKVFPFSQYFVQNVESALTLEQGANEIVYTGLYAQSSTYTASVTLIGDDGMFKVTSGGLTKKYNGSRDRITYDINGESELNSLKLSMMGMSIDSSQFVLPITNNMDIVVESGGKLTINQDAAMLPGVALSIANGADVTVASGRKLYVYDSAEWDKYACNQKFYSVQYAPSKAYNRTDKDLVDAKIDVNGTLTAAGEIYTTASGADIESSGGTGQYIQTGKPGADKVTHQYTQSGSSVTDHEIAVTPAKLKNADKSYTETVTAKVGETINYVNGKWGGAPVTYTVTWVNDDGTELQKDENVAYGSTPKYNGATPTKAADAQYTYTFKGWTPAVNKVTGNVTYTATYDKKVNQYTITWKNDDGTVLKTEKLDYGATPAYSGDTPTKAKTDQYEYTFTGWKAVNADGKKTDIVTVTSDATYIAQYSSSVRKYTITWKNDDGTVLKTEKLDYGTTPNYSGAAPTKADDAKYNYEFKGWTPEIHAVSGDEAYTAKFEESTRVYTVTWIVNGVETTEQVAYGVKPQYKGTPSKAEDTRHTYEFSGWNNEIAPVTDNVTYTAQFTTIGKNGLSVETDGTYWLENGEPVLNKGLVRVNAGTEEAPVYHYYYFAADGKAVANGIYKVENNNNLPLPAGNNYNFGTDGIIEHDNDTTKNGIAKADSDGEDYYFIDGVKVGIGLFEYNGSYYYARTSTAKIVKNQQYYISKSNYANIPTGVYMFDAVGKMQLMNGFVTEGGHTYYYVNNEKVKGFTKIGDDYYMFNTNSGVMYTGELWVNDNDYGIVGGMYYFGADGKMKLRNGFITEGGHTYYYVNNEKVKGFAKIGNDYYIFNANSGVMYTGELWVNANDFGVEVGYHTFDSTGRMVK